MPSPVGHTLGALAAGWAAAGPTDRRSILRRSLIIAALGLAPDLDLLVGRHSMETHSVGAAVLAGVLAAALRWPIAATRLRILATAALVWFTHPVLDAFAADTSAPLGVMILWPFSREHVMFDPMFGPISRRWWVPGFVTNNLIAVARELTILGPAALVSWLVTQRVRSAGQGPRDRQE